MASVRAFNLVMALAMFLLVLTGAFGESFSCPARINLHTVSKSPPKGWVVYAKDRTELKTSATHTPGTFHGVNPHDGRPDAILGWLIPDNDDKGESEGFWFWNISNIGDIYIGCDYYGTNVWLIKKAENNTLHTCRTDVSGKGRYLLTCI